jgi:phage tail tape-measure protein
MIMNNDLTKRARDVIDSIPEVHKRRGAAAGVGAAVGATVGSILGGPIGAAVGGALGTAIGEHLNAGRD